MFPSQLRPAVFWIPFGFLLVTTGLSLYDKATFFTAVTSVNQFILSTFGPLFSWTTFLAVVLMVVVYLSPLAQLRIGGANARPQLNRWQWFTITLTTTIATGILFWGCAEPLYHLHQPPEGSGVTATTVPARRFAMSTMFLHWTITPYSIYTTMALMFAICYYNRNTSFSLSSILQPALGPVLATRLGGTTDIICLFALVAGMAASLGAGMLTISGGLQYLFALPPSVLQYAMIGGGLVLAFCLSSASGLMRGIRVLSDYNIRAFVLLAIFVVVCGPTIDLFCIGGEGLVAYAKNFLPHSTHLFRPLATEWQQSWSTFYWANWLAWAPVTALFLGRIGYGYRVRDFIHFNLLLPALFGALWMIIFSGTVLHFDQADSEFPMYNILQQLGPERVIYAVFEHLPFSRLVSVLFLFLVFLSYVTAADSNTSAMSSISVHDHPDVLSEAPLRIKLAWGILIGLVAWTMIAYAGIDGLKIISTLGGFPALFLLIVVMIGFIRLLWRWQV